MLVRNLIISVEYIILHFYRNVLRDTGADFKYRGLVRVNTIVYSGFRQGI